MSHIFKGKWITDKTFENRPPRNVFHRQLEPLALDTSERRGLHILFRKHLTLPSLPKEARLYVSADDYYKLYVNGSFVAQGPAPAYHFRYSYNEIDLLPYLKEGENVLAFHTYYQGLINRVWQSGDDRHGLLCDLVLDGETVLCSDESFLTAPHTGYTETGVCGYDTQLLERYDSRAPEADFYKTDFDDSAWATASLSRFDDHTMCAPDRAMLVHESIRPVASWTEGNTLVYDFGACYVGYLCATVVGKDGQAVTVRCAQERNEDGSIRHALRANCVYEEEWILREGESALSWFDYKSFRYASLTLPEGATVKEVYLAARHYPFALRAHLKEAYRQNSALCRIWELCVHTQKYGVQEVIQDCMDREKGFYLGDGCYTALTHLVLTHDDAMVRKLIDDAFASSFITDTLVTCMDCSFMQEIAEYPLILVLLVLWHYRIKGDRAYLAETFPKIKALLDAYRRAYEKEGLLRDLDKWCVVEWPKNFQHGYDVDIREGRVCHEAHVSLNAYYIAAVRSANRIAEILGKAPYREEAPLLSAFRRTFFDEEKGLYRDGEHTAHISLVGNSFVYAFGLYEDEATKERILALYDAHGISSLGLFCTFPLLCGFYRDKDEERLLGALTDEGAWLRMLREDATATFEGWGKDTKWNTSLFHLTMSFAAVFLADL